MGIGKKHALKIYDQFVTDFSCLRILYCWFKKFQEIAHLRSIFFCNSKHKFREIRISNQLLYYHIMYSPD